MPDLSERDIPKTIDLLQINWVGYVRWSQEPIRISLRFVEVPGIGRALQPSSHAAMPVSCREQPQLRGVLQSTLTPSIRKCLRTARGRFLPVRRSKNCLSGRFPRRRLVTNPLQSLPGRISTGSFGRLCRCLDYVELPAARFGGTRDHGPCKQLMEF